MKESQKFLLILIHICYLLFTTMFIILKAAMRNATFPNIRYMKPMGKSSIIIPERREKTCSEILQEKQMTAVSLLLSLMKFWIQSIHPANRAEIPAPVRAIPICNNVTEDCAQIDNIVVETNKVSVEVQTMVDDDTKVDIGIKSPLPAAKVT